MIDEEEESDDDEDEDEEDEEDEDEEDDEDDDTDEDAYGHEGHEDDELSDEIEDEQQWTQANNTVADNQANTQGQPVAAHQQPAPGQGGQPVKPGQKHNHGGNKP